MNTKNFKPNITFIIPTYTNYDGLNSVLKDIAKLYSDFSIVLVNNGKGTPEVPSSLHKCIVVQEVKNVGFAKGCNDGASTAKKQFNSDYYIFLNDDVHFSKDWVTECINKLEKNNWIATTPLLKRPNGHLENIGYRVLKNGKVALLNEDNNHIDGLTAAALLFKSGPFHELKGFDERFFAYLEDVDLFLRAKKADMKFGVTASAFVLHQGQATSSKMSVKKAWLDFKNWILLIIKNWTVRDLLTNAPGIIIERLRNGAGLIKAIFASIS